MTESENKPKHSEGFYEVLHEHILLFELSARKDPGDPSSIHWLEKWKTMFPEVKDRIEELRAMSDEEFFALCEEARQDPFGPKEPEQEV